MIFVKIGRGYVENISHIFIHKKHHSFRGGVSTQKCYPVFLTFCRTTSAASDFILIFFLFFFRQFIIWYQILVDPSVASFSHHFSEFHSPVVELMIPAPRICSSSAEVPSVSGSVRQHPYSIVYLHHMYRIL